MKKNRSGILKLLETLEKKYPHEKKGIFMPNDTHANVLLNLLFSEVRKNCRKTYRLLGFDNSPISREAVIPTSTVGQQISAIAETAMALLSSMMEERKKRRPEPMKGTGPQNHPSGTDPAADHRLNLFICQGAA